MLGRLEEPTGDTPAAVPMGVFESILAGLVAAKRLEAAFEMFRRLRTRALLEPTGTMYVAMIRACGLAGDADQAQRLFRELSEREDPSPEAREELIVVLAGQKRTTREAFRVFGDAARRGDPLSLRLCGCLAAACGRSGLADEAKLLRRRMLAAGVQPDSKLRCDLVRAFLRAAARASTGPGSAVSPTSETSRHLAYAWQVVAEARAAGGQLPVDLLNALVAGYCEAGLPGHAVELLGMGPELGCAPNGESYALVLAALQSNPQGFQDLWRHMLSSANVKPTADMLERALQVAIAERNLRWAHAVLQLMFAARAQPSPGVATTLRALPQSEESKALRQLLNAFDRLR